MLKSKQWVGFLRNCVKHMGGSGIAYFCRLSGEQTSSSYSPSGSNRVPVNRKGEVTVPAHLLWHASGGASRGTRSVLGRRDHSDAEHFCSLFLPPDLPPACHPSKHSFCRSSSLAPCLWFIFFFCYSRVKPRYETVPHSHLYYLHSCNCSSKEKV